jgi:serine/threonine protein kinase
MTVASAYLQATNVLVNDVGNINICDFGLSQLKLDMKRKSKDSGDIVGRGTMRWLSPERMQGGQLTWKCDVYSFGMVIYEVSSISIVILTFRFIQKGQSHWIMLTTLSSGKTSCVRYLSCERTTAH